MTPDATATADAIRRKARNLGFADCRICACEPAPPREKQALTDWLAQGMHGGMAWFHKQAEARTEPHLRFPWAKSVVVLRWDYATAHPDAHADSIIRRVARYAATLDYHDQLSGPLEKLQSFMRRFPDGAKHDGAKHAPSSPAPAADEPVRASDGACHALWYQDTGPILEHLHAQRAGIGWTGKHTLTLNEHDGSYFFLAEVITSLELPPDEPALDHCGTCTACIDACPTGAIFEPYRLDARRCISYLTIEHEGPVDAELRPKLSGLLYGCDICQEVCPHNVRSTEKRGARAPADHWRSRPLEALTVSDLLLLTDPKLEAALAGTPLVRSGPARLKRNAALVAGAERDPGALKGLIHCLTHPEAQVREACVWALGNFSVAAPVPPASSRPPDQLPPAPVPPASSRHPDQPSALPVPPPSSRPSDQLPVPPPVTEAHFRQARQALSTHQKRESEEWVRDSVISALSRLTASASPPA